ncbi:MAG TPA: polysaccharide deacetylase family protein [Gaiellaceae bacterium]|nr:polysaccharide deacetylase family protein [Gaiellaceae bacterium]
MSGPLTTARDALAELRAALLCRRLRRTTVQAGVALVYHRVDGEGGDASREILPALSSRSFARQIRHLRRHYRLVPASELVAAVRSRGRGEPFPACVTFDDDLAGHVHEVLPVLAREGVTATFFLGGVSLERPHAFWWQDLQRVVDDRLADAVPHVAETDFSRALAREPKAIFRVAATIEQLPPPQRAETADALRGAAGPARDDGLRADDIRRLLAAGCEVGFHTLGHDALPQLDDGALEAALRNGRDRLEELVGRRLVLISYPHGKADERVARAARAAGYEGGFATGRAAVAAETDPLLVPRIPPALAPGKTALRIARAVASCTSR